MKALSRIERAKNAWNLYCLTLEIADALTRGLVRRTLENKVRDAHNTGRPSEIIKVKSERR